MQDTILSMYQFPIGMEMFSAGDEEQWEIIKDTIDSSDYYVLIIAHRYGSKTTERISYTEKEYQYAKSKGIPILAFIIDNEVLVKPDYMEKDPNSIERLKLLKNDVTNGRVVQWWKSKEELSQLVTNSLYKQFNRKKRPGWVRADNINLEETQNELIQMRKMVRKLEEENDKLKNQDLKENKNIINIDSFIYNYDYYLTVGDNEVKKLIDEISNTYSSHVSEYFEKAYKKKVSYFHINDTNRGFWKNFLEMEDKAVLNGVVEFLYNHSELFTNIWYKEFPELFKMIVDKHKIFIQKELAPLLEKNYSIDEEAFWRLLYDILKYDSRLIDLYKVTNQYNKLIMINEYNFNKNEIDVFNKYKVFKQFISNAGKEYFYNNSSDHWDYYSHSNNYDDDYPEMCFKLLKWDLELIQKIDKAYFDLEDNIKSRNNMDSLYNGNKRRESYDRVIGDNSYKILSVIKSLNKNISDFPYIERSMKKQNII